MLGRFDYGRDLRTVEITTNGASFRGPQEDMNMNVHRWKTIAALVAVASLVLAIGATPSQGATPAESTQVSAGLSASDLAKLPLTNRDLTRRERANLAAAA
jgi:hypothetical protein